MRIEHFFDCINVNDVRELQRTIYTASAEKPNEFWVSGTDSYPCLCISTNDGLAHVHYFQDEDTTGFQAIGNSNLNEEIITFYTNNSSEKIEIEKKYVVPLNIAVEIASEFFVSQKMPKCAEWDEL